MKRITVLFAFALIITGCPHGYGAVHSVGPASYYSWTGRQVPWPYNTTNTVYTRDEYEWWYTNTGQADNLILNGSPAGSGPGGSYSLNLALLTNDADGIRVGVVDSGVTDTFPDLAGTVAAGCYYDSRSQSISTNYSDYDAATSHGTQCASLIAGRGTNILGAAPGAQILAASIAGYTVPGMIQWPLNR